MSVQTVTMKNREEYEKWFLRRWMPRTYIHVSPRRKFKPDHFSRDWTANGKVVKADVVKSSEVIIKGKIRRGRQNRPQASGWRIKVNYAEGEKKEDVIKKYNKRG